MSMAQLYAFNWEDCIKKYEKARQFNQNVRLSYNYLKSTKQCLLKFKLFLIQNPHPNYTVEAMSNNILMLEQYMNQLIPKYSYPNNTLQTVPRYINLNLHPIFNNEYDHFKRFKQCNGIHVQNKIYTAKHCNIPHSKNIRFDLSYIPAKKYSNLKTAPLDLKKKGVFKYYSMSKEGMFYNVLLKERNCQFYKAKNHPEGLNTTLDLSDLTKKEEIRSSCLAIPSNSGGGVFQEGKLVGIISKTVFKGNEFKYSIIEPIVSLD
jgi:hypothetical protein